MQGLGLGGAEDAQPHGLGVGELGILGLAIGTQGLGVQGLGVQGLGYRGYGFSDLVLSMQVLQNLGQVHYAVPAAGGREHHQR